MKVIADVKCYHCGFISGQLVGEQNGRIRPESFHPVDKYPRPLPRSGDILRCGRCGGPVYLEDVRIYHKRIVEPIPPARRGRPRGAKTLAKAS
ncbi:MAG: hypothetical protein M1343_01575 [Chloroflexi bacterium]|nr:hypothetical protein [Chloroflexota bacterium]MDA8188866.1 hypothetical protein [Dehalococcoidales bacterium]